ncbi:MAG: hypothetical protein V4531_10645 [Actinomycetota bacterium]
MTDATCVEGENHIAVHQGPVALTEFDCLVREIAGALVDVDIDFGRGQTYTNAPKWVRARANIGKNSNWSDAINGQTVAEWMAHFVPAVAIRYSGRSGGRSLCWTRRRIDSRRTRNGEPRTKWLVLRAPMLPDVAPIAAACQDFDIQRCVPIPVPNRE